MLDGWFVVVFFLIKDQILPWRFLFTRIILFNGDCIWPLYSPQVSLQFFAIFMTLAISAAIVLNVLSPATFTAHSPLWHLCTFFPSFKSQLKNKFILKIKTKFIASSTETPSPSSPFMHPYPDPSRCPESMQGFSLLTSFETSVATG